jgi:hypothetical protein
MAIDFLHARRRLPEADRIMQTAARGRNNMQTAARGRNITRTAARGRNNKVDNTISPATNARL